MLILLFLQPLNFADVSEMVLPTSDYRSLGVPGAGANALDVRDCLDTALKYIGCDDWLPNVPSNGDYKGTIAIIEPGGISVSQWVNLELGYEVDSGTNRLWETKNRHSRCVECTL